MTLIDGVYLGNEVDGYSPTSIDISGADPTLYRVTGGLCSWRTPCPTCPR